MSQALLKMENITKTFAGVKALDAVELEVQRGSIHALVGENGAGKSTLMNILSGVYPCGTYSGEIIYENEVAQFKAINDSEAKGIVIIQQELALIPELSIYENIFLGHEKSKYGVVDWNREKEEARQYAEDVGLHEDIYTPCKYLGVGKQQLVEIAKALSKNVRLLIMDEPTAALNDNDSEALLRLIFKLRKERGITVIIISHKLDEILSISDRITVLRDGKTITTMENDGSISKSVVISSMVGREMANLYPPRKSYKGPLALEVEDWEVYSPNVEGKKVIDKVNLKLHYGEIVGIAGLMGAGRTELALSLFGKAYGTNISGRIIKDGKPLHIKSVRNAIDNGIAYLPEDRKLSGLILDEDSVINISLPNLEQFSKHGVMNRAAEVGAAEKYTHEIRIKSTSVFQKTRMLSGGNQQKVLVARWLCNNPDILILDEPTRGIDVGAKYEIYTIIQKLAESGKAVLFISSELPEVIGMSDRIYVMNEGRIVGELLKDEASQEKIMQLIIDNNGGG